MKHTIILTDSEEIIVQQLCEDGIGTTMGEAENLTIDELITLKIRQYLEGKGKVQDREVRENLTDEEVAAAIASRS